MTANNEDPAPRNRFGIPELSPNLPARNNPILRNISCFLFWLWGWEFDGDLPSDLSQAVAIGAPHTSNWDFVIVMIAIFAINIQLSLMGKHTIFVWPFRRLLRWMGLIPAYRDAPTGLVGQAIEQFKQNEKFILAIAPEGTRSKVGAWRTGFHRVALGAKVPLIPVGLDFGNKRIKIGKQIWPTEDMDADMVKIKAFYADVVGKRPSLGLDP